MDTLATPICFLVYIIQLVTGSSTQRTRLDLASGQFMTRCTTEEADSMTIRCPRRHVMLPPVVMAGHGVNNRCVFNRRDCLGLTQSLDEQRRGCAFQEVCTVNLQRTTEPLTRLAGQNKACGAVNMSYVSVRLPKCVSKDHVYNACSGSKIIPIIPGSGVLKGSTHYDRPCFNTTTCKRRFGLTSDLIALTFNMEDAHLDKTGRPKIIWTSEQGKLKKRKLRNFSTFSEIGSKFELIWRHKGISRVNQEFILLFRAEYIRLNRNPSIPNDQSATPPPKTPARDSATMENAMSWDAKRSVALSCPPRKVIYAPRVAVGTSTDTKCRGISPRLLVRRNECYWRQNCTLSWRGPALLAMSTSPRCYGRTGDVLLTKGHTCVNKDDVITICDGDVSRRLKSSGVIRSHVTYPWNYSAVTKTCRLRIKIGRGRKLDIHVDDVDVDVETDVFTIKHIRKGRKTSAIVTKNSKNMSHVLKGGVVLITLKTKKHSKTGSGFIIRYKRQRINGRKGRSGRKRRPRRFANRRWKIRT